MRRPHIRTAQNGAGVVVLHGHGHTARSMLVLTRRLRAAGYQVWAPSYPSFRATMPEIVAHLQPGLAEFQARLDGPLHIVTHSLGGLVARALLAADRPHMLGRVVMLAPPNNGSEWVDLLFRLRMDKVVLGPVAHHLRTRRSRVYEDILGPVDFELGIIAGNRPLDPIFPKIFIQKPNDGKVSVTSTCVTGMTDHVIIPVSHTFMVTNARVADQVRRFLQKGRFHHQ